MREVIETVGMDIPRWKWRNREALIQEIDARGRIHDIQLHYDLKEAIDVKWWEPLLKILLVVAAIGFAVTFVYLLQRAIDLYGALAPQANGPGPRPESLRIAFWMIAGSFGVMLVAALLSIEMLLARIAAMRRYLQIQSRAIESLAGQIHDLRSPAAAETASPDHDPEEA